MSICSVDGCDKDAVSRGVCNTHYMQLRRAALIPIGTRAVGSLEERFWRHVNKDGDCWLWTAHTSSGKGYGRLGEGGKGGKYLHAHRVSYELHNGPIPDGYVVMHQCDNPSCVNPAHLSVGTTAQNIKDAYNKGRKVTPFKAGAAHHMAILDDEKVRFIRGNLHISAGVLAKQYGIARSAITAIRRRQTWKHVT